MALSSLMILILLCVSGVWANAAGPPINTYPYSHTLCTDMLPIGHGQSTATTPAPYRITTSSTYSPGQPITVAVESTDGISEIEGLFMQARRRGTGRDQNQAIGVFSDSPNKTQLLTCGTPNSAWGHSGELEATVASVTWTPPPCDEGPIAFMATIVKGPKELYWTGILSSEMTFAGTSNGDCSQGGMPPKPSSPPPSPTAGSAGLVASAMLLMMGVVTGLCLAVFK